jgi:hypothetical protein
MADGPNEATSPAEILARILNPNEAKTETEWVCADEITRLKAEVERKDAALEKVNHAATWGGLSRNKLADIARAALNPSQEPGT